MKKLFQLYYYFTPIIKISINQLIMQSTDKNQNKEFYTLHFVHPKLINKKYTLHCNYPLFEVRPILSQISLLYYFDNFHFEQKGKKLNETEPICNVLNPQIPIDIVLDCYKEVTAKYHLIKVNQILTNPKLYKHVLIKSQGKIQQTIETQPQDKIKFDLEKQQLEKMLDFDFNNEMFKINDKPKLQLVTFLSLSGFNPPPYTQRLCGDLFYLHVRTLQCQDFHITASPQGFYVNQSKITNFNPQISTTYKTIYLNFIDLLRAISDKFRQNLAYIIEELEFTQTDVYQCGAIKQRNDWLAQCNYQHTWHNETSMKQMMKIPHEGNKQWNELLQLASQDGGKTLQQHKMFTKLYNQFQVVALQGAKSIIDGKIAPLNPNDDIKKHIYIFDNIFYSIASETPFDHSQERGDDATPSASSINADLQYVNILEKLNIPELHVLHMMIVSYRGFKVISQCIIPGILSGDQSNCSQYGSIDDGKTIQTNPQFQKIMLQICEKLNLKKQVKLKDAQGQQKIICGSPEIKGIRGSDKRKYILDLARLSPRDLNYIGKQHEFCLIRPKIIEEFMKYKKQKKQEIPQINTNIGTQIQFIPDEHIQKQTKFLQQMSQYIIKIAIPSLINALKSTMSSFLSDSKGISDAFHEFGVNIRYLGTVCNHQLLKNEKDITLCLSKVILARSLKHLFRIAMRQTNVLYLNQVITHLLNSIFSKKSVIAQLEQGTYVSEQLNQGQSKQTKKKKKKKNKQSDKIQQKIGESTTHTIVPPIKIPPPQFLNMKPSEIWAFVRNIAQKRYKFDIGKSLDENQILKLPFCKMSLLRDLCLSTGLVIERKRYNIIQDIDIEDTSLPFTLKNIAGLNAIVKKKKNQLQILNNYITEAEAHVQKFQIKQAIQKYNSASGLILNLQEGFAQDLSRVYTSLGKISYIMGDYDQCVRRQLMSSHLLENIEGVDDRKTIQSYSTLGLYYSAKGQASKAAYYLYKSIFLMLMSFGQTYPDFFVSISNLTRLYNNCKQYTKAQNIHLRAIQIINLACGKYHFKTTFFYAALANICYQIGDLKKAIFYQTQCVGILMAVLPENDVRLLDAKKILKVYRQMNISKSFHHQPKPEQIPMNNRVNSRQKKR